MFLAFQTDQKTSLLEQFLILTCLDENLKMFLLGSESSLESTGDTSSKIHTFSEDTPC